MADDTGASSTSKAGPNFLGLISLAGVLVLGVMLFSAHSNVRALETKLTAVQTEQGKIGAQVREAMNAEMTRLREAAAADEATRQKTLTAIHNEMNRARRQATGAAGRVKEEALKSLQELESRVAGNEQRLRENTAQLATEITGVKQATTQAQTGVASVSNEVRDVRTDVANTRTQLDRTVADLRRVTGDMGVLSGLIATNQKEIDALKLLGDRNYTQFTVKKTKTAVQIGDVMLLLKKADTGRNRYTVELLANDQKIEKRDRAANEPVQFYVGRNKQPHELVVNQVQKDTVVGYIATPKVAATRP